MISEKNITHLCIVEEQRNLRWVLDEVKNWIPSSSKLVWNEAESEIDVYCTPELTSEEQTQFEEEFEKYDFTDIAYLA